jgi:hypothetical protein
MIRPFCFVFKLNRKSTSLMIKMSEYIASLEVTNRFAHGYFQTIYSSFKIIPRSCLFDLCNYYARMKKFRTFTVTTLGESSSRVSKRQIKKISFFTSLFIFSLSKKIAKNEGWRSNKNRMYL